MLFCRETLNWTKNFFSVCADWSFIIIRFLFLDASQPKLFLRIGIMFTSNIITGFADAHTDLSLRFNRLSCENENSGQTARIRTETIAFAVPLLGQWRS